MFVINENILVQFDFMLHNSYLYEFDWILCFMFFVNIVYFSCDDFSSEDAIYVEEIYFVFIW